VFELTVREGVTFHRRARSLVHPEKPK
jgi:hypothetical protein